MYPKLISVCNFRVTNNRCSLKNLKEDKTEFNFNLCDEMQNCIIYQTYFLVLKHYRSVKDK